MRLETRVVMSAEGIELFVRQYRPSVIDPGRVIYWVHGLGEHGGRLDHVAGYLTGRGWSLIIADLRGHGRSGGTATHVTSFDQYVVDIQTIWTELGFSDPVPALLGHSMGGLVAVRAVQSGLIQPSALVLSSPLLGLKLRVNPLTKLIGRALVRFYPTVRFSNGIDPTNMTSDSEFAAARRGDPLINKTVTASWFFAMQRALVAAQRETSKVSLPVLAVQGSNDRTTDPEALAEWMERIPAERKSLLLLPDHVHELFFEPDWLETTRQMLDWLESAC